MKILGLEDDMYLLLTRLEIVVQCNAFKATWCVSFGMATR
jgi:hypothetical protein